MTARHRGGGARESAAGHRVRGGAKAPLQRGVGGPAVDAPDDDAGGGDGTVDLLRIGPARIRVLSAATIPSCNPVTGHLPRLIPAEMILEDEICAFLRARRPPLGRYAATGVATFGPAGADPSLLRPEHGTILSGSLKRELQGVNLLGPVAEAHGLLGPGDRESVGFETDVNAGTTSTKTTGWGGLSPRPTL